MTWFSVPAWEVVGKFDLAGAKDACTWSGNLGRRNWSCIFGRVASWASQGAGFFFVWCEEHFGGLVAEAASEGGWFPEGAGVFEAPDLRVGDRFAVLAVAVDDEHGVVGPGWGKISLGERSGV